MTDNQQEIHPESKTKHVLSDTYLKTLDKFLSKKRLIHSLEVANLSEQVALHYKYPKPKDAYLAGLFHDIAKELSLEEMIKYAEKYVYNYQSKGQNTSSLLHAPVSMLITKHELGIKTPAILSAIQYHTTGKANMRLLEKIIYLADIGHRVNIIPHALKVMKTIYKDIDQAVLITAKATLCRLLEKDKVIHRHSLECYNFYQTTV